MLCLSPIAVTPISAMIALASIVRPSRDKRILPSAEGLIVWPAKVLPHAWKSASFLKCRRGRKRQRMVGGASESTSTHSRRYARLNPVGFSAGIQPSNASWDCHLRGLVLEGGGSTMSNHDSQAMQQAFDAVEEHMLPGLDDAAVEAGPRVLLAAQFVLAEAWVELGYSLDALREVIDAIDPARGGFNHGRILN
jgi:hypothetical protein